MVGAGACGYAQISVTLASASGAWSNVLAVTSTYESIMSERVGGCLICRKVRGIRISCNLMPPVVAIVRHL